MTKPRRFGMVIGLKEDRAKDYVALHAGPGVRDLLTAAHIRNFNIFVTRMPDGKLYEFAYYEYWGSDYEADMAAMMRDPGHVAWLDVCDPMQVPLPGHTSWAEMEQIYFNW
ncbi:MAG: L-rhamnose mutarotase [Rhizobium sp.]|nr:L-rhamnose mutarotase [Rhizobium sp.]